MASKSSGSKPSAKQSKKKKKNAKRKKEKRSLVVVHGNREALLFVGKLSKYMQAQQSGLLPSDIPFNWSEFFKGTQAPTLRLYLFSNVIATTASTNLATVLSLTAAQFQHFTDLAAVFDEYRPIGAEIEFVPNAWPYFQNGASHQAHLSTAIGVIDYDNATALANLDEALEYDTRKWFYLTAAPDTAEKCTTHWPVILEKLPDQTWLDTTVTNTVFANWKMFCNGADIDFSNARVGYLVGWMDFQFRASG